jgi:hypothetical protein
MHSGRHSRCNCNIQQVSCLMYHSHGLEVGVLVLKVAKCKHSVSIGLRDACARRIARKRMRVARTRREGVKVVVI